MTERYPMLPPRADECEIIQFSTARVSAKRVDKIEASTRAIAAEPIWRRERSLPEPLTETCKNQRLRDGRRDAWRCAEAATRYWRARLDFERAVESVQRLELPEGRCHPIVNSASDLPMVTRFREALVTQLLTPAPDVGAVNWKRAQMRAGNHRYTDAKPERLQRAIDADVEWLEAHPTRKSVAASRQAEAKDETPAPVA
jgi:hypothetical protein